MNTEEFDERIASVEAFLDERRALEKTRGWRNKVSPLSLGHEDYRKTKLWKQIKGRIFLRDGNKCRRCSGNAEVVHHINYNPDVMLGRDDSKLVALCSGCHEIIHVDQSGINRAQKDQIIALTDLGLNEAHPKVAMRRDPFRIPTWRRLTAIQKQIYLDEYNSRKMKRRCETYPISSRFPSA